MLNKKFVQKYLNIKELLKNRKITNEKYKSLILCLCDNYNVPLKKLIEYNMDIEPRKFNIKSTFIK